MLTEKQREMLTAYVDGELGPRQRKLIERLVRKSPAARQLLRDLEADAQQLRALQTPTIPVDLSSRVLQSLGEPRVLPFRRPVRAPHKALPWWSGMAAVAAVLGLVSLTSFLYFQMTTTEPVSVQHARQEKVELFTAGTSKDILLPHDPIVQHKTEDPRYDLDPFAFVGPVKDADEGTALLDPRVPDPMKMSEPGTAIGSPAREDGSVGTVDAAIPALMRIRELTLEPQQTDLKNYLRKGNTLYIELLGRDSAKSYDRVQAGLLTSGIELVKDAPVLTRRKQANLPTSYLFYVEGITVDELTKLLQNVSAEDGKAEKKNRGDAQFNLPHANLILTRLTEDHRRALHSLIGADLKPVPSPSKGTGPLGVDIHKDVAENTGNQVTKTMDKAPARQALALVYQPALARAGSLEVKQFLDHRKPARDNTLQVVLVLRPLAR